MNKLAPFLFLFIWSSGAVVVKFGLQYASVWSFLAARSLVSMCCLIMLFWLYSYRKPSLIRSPSKTELRRILVVGALLQVCYLSFYFLAIDTGISPGLVTLILGLQPLLTPFLCKQQVSRRQLALLLLGFLGLVISIYGAKDLTQLAAYGVVFGIAALFFYNVWYGVASEYCQSCVIECNVPECTSYPHSYGDQRSGWGEYYLDARIFDITCLDVYGGFSRGIVVADAHDQARWGIIS